MDIEVRKHSVYLEVVVLDGSTIMSSGLLDKKEAAQLAFQLEQAAEQLAPDDYGEQS